MEAGTLIEWLVKPGDRVARGDVVAVVETQKGAIEIEDLRGRRRRAARRPYRRPAPGRRTARGPSRGGGGRPRARRYPPRRNRRRGGKPSWRKRRESPGRARGRAGRFPCGAGACRRARDRADRPRRLGPRRRDPAGRCQAAPPKERPAAKPGSTWRRCARRSRRRWRARSGRSRTTTSARPSTCSRRPTGSALETRRDRRRSWPPDGHALRQGGRAGGAGGVRDERLARQGGVCPPPRSGSTLALRSRCAAAGVIAPAIHDADGLGLDKLMAAMRDLVARVRTGRLRSSEMTDGTITVFEPRRGRSGRPHGCDLPAAGGPSRLRRTGAAAVGDGRSGGAADHRHRDPRRRPPRERRAAGGPVPRRNR